MKRTREQIRNTREKQMATRRRKSIVVVDQRTREWAKATAKFNQRPDR
jgi:hypothetical protein